ncbi:unnamed protein product [Prorocentrum cordatum]|uniref:RBPJ-interacting and tubulin-associated protein n=1 Tax=Prorocentrum cordatum TaxID=2364126 RepID=A0ABN9VLN1_9DINO|nr:unnamed protein product [Polarella glacialis]
MAPAAKRPSGFDNDPRNPCLKSEDAKVPFAELLEQISKSKVEHAPEPQARYRPPKPCWQEPNEGFRVGPSTGRTFDAAPGFLKPKQFNAWDTERILAPTRTYPVRGSAGEMYDNARDGLPPWRPTKWGHQTGESFPLDSAPPLPAQKGGKAPRSSTATPSKASAATALGEDGGAAAPKPWEKQRPVSAQAGATVTPRRTPRAASMGRPASQGCSRAATKGAPAPAPAAAAPVAARTREQCPGRANSARAAAPGRGGPSAPGAAPGFPPRPKPGLRRPW